MSSGSAPLLIIRRPAGSTTEVSWMREVITIGRDSTNDIVIDHPLASRRHARLERDSGAYYVRDLDSTNGTLVNSGPIDGPRQLRHQDRIWVADAEITFNDPDATQKGIFPVEILRRTPQAEEVLQFDADAREIAIGGKPLEPPLTVKEFQLLRLLYERRGQVVSKAVIARDVWDYPLYDYNAIDALIYRLRQRIELDPANPRFVVTVRGVGYRLIVRPEPVER
jgi:pSer/pThr/pTyr-binding forkhead associated (FHA) protein